MEEKKEIKEEKCLKERCPWEVNRFKNGEKETVLCFFPSCSYPLFSNNEKS